MCFCLEDMTEYSVSYTHPLWSAYIPSYPFKRRPLLATFLTARNYYMACKWQIMLFTLKLFMACKL